VATGHHYFRWEYQRLKHGGLQICHRIWDSRGGGFELYRLLWRDDVQSCKNLKRFSEKNTDSSSSERQAKFLQNYKASLPRRGQSWSLRLFRLHKIVSIRNVI
jgi:hypothetical protein